MENENNVPFKVFNTQEEFDNHAGSIKYNVTKDILGELGLKDKSEIDTLRNEINTLKSEYEKVKADNEELSNKTVEYEERQKDLELNEKLKSYGIEETDIDYVKFDMARNNMNLDNEGFDDFISKSRFVKKTETNTQETQETEVQNTEVLDKQDPITVPTQEKLDEADSSRTTDFSNLGQLEQHALNQFLK